MDEGVIKFRCDWLPAYAPAEKEILSLNQWRSRLYQLGLIGAYPNGIGYGNISVRAKRGRGFIISGTQTGGLATLGAQQYTRIVAYRFEENMVRCKGPVKASSESLTHAMLYELDAVIGAVIHVHHEKQWRRLLGNVPTTSAKIRYGTPEMAKEVSRLYQTEDLRQKKLFVMGGHESGIVSFGKDLEEAGETLLTCLE